ncbi:MAG: MEMO1 family protein [Candidatus Korarchaeum sp.]|nr:MEMO1 family protein [Candidatus Korarchaeum sp.]MDW8035712.1 MEMO1 family protein [Candidatus Korarchaeum sp.]
MRRPAVVGSFYPSRSSDLVKLIESLFKNAGAEGIPTPNEVGERRIASIISPHAGYIYSGRAAASAYSLLAQDGVPDSFVIIGPNHTGLGSAFAVTKSRLWETPLGRVEVDIELAEAIADCFGELYFDDLAHAWEHSIEVQVPFLQAIYGSRFKLVPIVMGLQEPEPSVELGRAVALASERMKRDTVVIASSDMSHYLPEDEAMRRDRVALEAILSMDVRALFRVIRELDVSMCGPGPASAAISFAKLKGVSRGELVRYSTSAETSGDKSFVVGYASVVFKR